MLNTVTLPIVSSTYVNISMQIILNCSEPWGMLYMHTYNIFINETGKQLQVLYIIDKIPNYKKFSDLRCKARPKNTGIDITQTQAFHNIVWRHFLTNYLPTFFINWNFNVESKNPAYGRQRISRPMRIVGPIQFWRGCVIYL